MREISYDYCTFLYSLIRCRDFWCKFSSSFSMSTQLDCSYEIFFLFLSTSLFFFLSLPKRKVVSFHTCHQDLEVCQHLSDSSFSKGAVNAGNQILAVRPKVDTQVPNSTATLPFEPTLAKECKAESKTALAVATLLRIITEPTWLFLLRIWIMYKRIWEKYL